MSTVFSIATGTAGLGEINTPPDPTKTLLQETDMLCNTTAFSFLPWSYLVALFIALKTGVDGD
jgi:hypothetical protein